MDLSQDSSRFSPLRILFFILSFVCLAIGAWGARAHYLRSAWGNPWQLIGWLFSMLFLLLAFAPSIRKMVIMRRKAAFFLFWILIFVVSHLWNFRTAPWNGNGLFDESGWD